MNQTIKEIESYLNTLKEDQRQREIKIKNFKGFLQADDPEGLIGLGKTLLLLKQEFQMVREFIYNIENALKLKESNHRHTITVTGIGKTTCDDCREEIFVKEVSIFGKEVRI